jgi:hypothetical protein
MTNKDLDYVIKLGEDREVVVYDTLLEMEKNDKKTTLDSNHSHFILVGDGATEQMDPDPHPYSSGEDRRIRAEFQTFVSRVWCKPNEEPNEECIPLVSVCVQGGQYTIDTVHQACKSGTPVLLVRGSGKAADLLSDAVNLQYSPSHPRHVRNLDTKLIQKQHKFRKFIRLCGVHLRYSHETNEYDWKKVIDYVEDEINVCEKWEKGGCVPQNIDFFKKAKELVMTTYNIDNITVKKHTQEQTTIEPYDPEYQKCLQIIQDSLDVAKTQKCWVYDMLSTDPGSDDFNGALLKCLLEGMTPKDSSCTHDLVGANVSQHRGAQGAQKLELSSLKKKLELSMRWSSDDYTHHLLEHMSSSIDEKQRQEIFDGALLFALKIGRVQALSKLIHRGRGLKMLEVGKQYCHVKHFFLHHGGATRKKALANENQGGQSRKRCYASFCFDFFGRKKAVPNEDSKDQHASTNEDSKAQHADAASKWTELIDDAQKKNHHFAALWKSRKKYLSDRYHFMDFSWGAQPAGKKSIEKIDKYHEDCWKVGHPIPQGLLLEIYQDLNQGPFDIQNEEAKSQHENMMNLVILEDVYVHLCGNAFRYRVGIQGTEFDLFFWYVLQNKRDLAFEMWKHVTYPAQSAIFAAYMLRKMAKTKYAEPPEQDKMLANAKYFEEKAVLVLQAAEDDDRDLAAASIDCDLELWRGMSLMDVAVKGECFRVLQTGCFKWAIRSRLYGDLTPYGNDTYSAQFKLICFTLTIGLIPAFFPRLLSWAPPPEAKTFRRKTQRRVILEGASTFGLLSRWGCFMTSPYVLFVLNSFMTIAVTLGFTVWYCRMKLEPSRSLDIQNNMTLEEILLSMHFGGCLMREFSQLLMFKLEYFFDGWNVPEMSSLIFFFVAFGFRVACTKSSECTSSTIEIGMTTYSFFYSLSLFFCWIRMLRIFVLFELGVTIGIFFSMMTTTIRFWVLYLILLVALSMLFIGTSDLDTLIPGHATCGNSTNLAKGDLPDVELPENGYMECAWSFVLLRTLFQSFGEFGSFFQQMTNKFNLILLILTYLSLNLVGLNLLIAMMSSTYAKVSARAQSQRCVYTYSLVHEYSQRAIAVPPPFNLILLMSDLIQFFWNSKGIRDLYPDYTFLQRLDKFLARNEHITTAQWLPGATHANNNKENDKDRRMREKISAFMEHARRSVMNRSAAGVKVDNKKFCTQCQAPVLPKDKYCGQCGTLITQLPCHLRYD